VQLDAPAFAGPMSNGSLRFHPTDNSLLLVYSKQAGDDTALCIVNLDPRHVHRGWVELDLAALELPEDAGYQVHDLLGDSRSTWRGPRNFVEIVPNAMPAYVFTLRQLVRSENQFEYYL